MCQQNKWEMDLSPMELRNLEEKFGFQIRRSDIPNGLTGNQNFILSTSIGVVVLTLIEEQSYKEVKCMAELYTWLENKKYDAPLLMPLPRTKEKIFWFREKPSFIKTYIYGDTNSPLDCAEIAGLGKKMAKLHTIDCPDWLEPQHFYEQEKFNLSLSSDTDTAFENWASKKLDSLELNSTRLPIGIIHGDLFRDNIVSNENKDICFIDYELACHHSLVFDIAMAIVGIWSSENSFRQSIISSIIDGYNSVRVLSDVEIRSLNAWIQYAAIKTAIWRYSRYKIGDYFHEDDNRYLEMVEISRQAEQLSIN